MFSGPGSPRPHRVETRVARGDRSDGIEARARAAEFFAGLFLPRELERTPVSL